MLTCNFCSEMNLHVFEVNDNILFIHSSSHLKWDKSLD